MTPHLWLCPSHFQPPASLLGDLDQNFEALSVGNLSDSNSQAEGTPVSSDAEGTQATPSWEPHFIEQHREQLIQRTATVEGVLDLLYGNVLDDEQYQRISLRETNPEKMRELYRLVPSWDRSCKDRLYEALRKKNPFLIAALEGR
ncbi:apoptosis-associated speck-like protein containing a CARD [Heteronotia binoei]|uniref:apoptosis-associated speck-like protein containing a CARD n=1 Tax=Heteronotia binoei TaxID=13085 RepID=UPI0029304FA9|nr:apoptosis-associated speck-like protein containing a CARD [Heteronotia binoei]